MQTEVDLLNYIEFLKSVKCNPGDRVVLTLFYYPDRKPDLSIEFMGSNSAFVSLSRKDDLTNYLRNDLNPEYFTLDGPRKYSNYLSWTDYIQEIILPAIKGTFSCYGVQMEVVSNLDDGVGYRSL